MISLLFVACNLEPDPLQSDLILLSQLESEPQNASSICSKLQGQEAISYCKAIEKRPHLWANPKTLKTNSQRKEGPASKHLVPSYTLNPPLKSQEVTPCPPEQNETLCREKRAKEAQSVEQAYSECNSLEKEIWRQECFFQAAEATLSSLGYNDSAILCLNTGDFQANCFMHLSYSLAETIPPALVEEKEEWDVVIQHSKAVDSFWLEKDPQFGIAMQEQLWAKAIDISYTKAGIVTGNPIDHLPPKAIPHIRAAASFHLLQMEGASAFTLEEWAKRIQRALDARLPVSAMRPPKPYQRRKLKNQWASDGKMDSNRPATYYMSDGRRTYSLDPHEDLLICVLEAATRVNNGQKLVEHGRNHSSPLVHWTAMRLSN